MKIAIDIRSLQDKKHSGVQEYVLSTLKELFELDKKNNYILFSIGIKYFSSPAINQIIKNKDNIVHKHIFFPNKILSFFWYFLNIPNLEKILGYPNQVFAPNLNIFPKAILRITTITFHDLSFKYFPNFFSYKSRLWHKIIKPGKLAQESNQLIAVSEATKNDIIENYKINEKKIFHIPLGKNKCLYAKIDPKKKEEIKNKYNLPNKFILFVGTLEPRKNITGIIKAFNLLLDKNKELRDYKLIFAGPCGWLYKKIFKEARKSLYYDKIFFIGPIEREDRAFIYNMANLFVYPSFFEGFGLPLLEAMTCGVPIITSNRSSISSVVAKSAIMIDPYKIGEIAWAMELVLLDKKLYSYLSRIGTEKSKEFSWRKTAQKLKEVIENQPN